MHSPGTYQCPPVKSIDLVVARDGFLCIMEIIRIFIVATMITEMLFKVFDLYCCVTSQQRRETDTSVSDDN